MKLLKLSFKAYKKYKHTTNKGGNLDYKTINRKLHRAFVLGREIYRTEEVIHRQYGKMTIVVDSKRFKILNIKNNTCRNSWINKREKEDLGILLGIEV